MQGRILRVTAVGWEATQATDFHSFRVNLHEFWFLAIVGKPRARSQVSRLSWVRVVGGGGATRRANGKTLS